MFPRFPSRNCVRRRGARAIQVPHDHGQGVKAMVRHVLFHPTRDVRASEHTIARAIIAAIRNDCAQAFASKYQDVGMSRPGRLLQRSIFVIRTTSALC
jgi:hypothetical protein